VGNINLIGGQNRNSNRVENKTLSYGSVKLHCVYIHNLLIRSSVVGHLDCFHSLVNVNRKKKKRRKNIREEAGLGV
jgi:hypothetical protein